MTLTSFAGAAILAVIVALQPGAERVYGPVFLLMALYRRVAREVAACLGYVYPEDIDRRVTLSGEQSVVHDW